MIRLVPQFGECETKSYDRNMSASYPTKGTADNFNVKLRLILSTTADRVSLIQVKISQIHRIHSIDSEQQTCRQLNRQTTYMKYLSLTAQGAEVS